MPAVGRFSTGDSVKFIPALTLVNFVSDDRYRIDKKTERLRWSTPIYSYKNYNGLNLSAKASALWHYPDREFSYADFDVQNVEYNVLEFK